MIGNFRYLACIIFFLLLFLSPMFDSQSLAATYYLSPNGSDSNNGVSAAPWRTFAYALPKLRPGDTLVLKDGAYQGSNSGYFSCTCGSNASNGTSTARITVKAENERRAFLQGDGNTYVLFMQSCAYWVFEGLRIESADYSGGSSQAMPVFALNSDSLTFRRLLVSRNNRYQNCSLLLLDGTNNSLVEDSEFYWFHRHAINIKGNANVIRRNYLNSRNHSDVSGGYPSGETSRGDSAIIIYPGSNNIIENNISEGNMDGYDIQAISPSQNNQFLGNISLGDIYGSILAVRNDWPIDNSFVNFVVVNAAGPGLFSRAGVNTRCYNCTIIGSGQGFTADKPSDGSCSSNGCSFYAVNSLATSNGIGFNMASPTSFSIDYPVSQGNGTNFSPASDSGYTNVRGLSPQLGNCRVFIPASSPLKGAGQNGNDIGANILYRYVNGSLTTEPLWNPATGSFSCGDVVQGVNDVSGSSCFEVHKRLNVNTNGCLLPSNYQSSRAPSPPPSLRIVIPAPSQ